MSQVNSKARRPALGLAALGGALVLVASSAAPAAQAEPTLVEIVVTADAFAPTSPGQITPNEFLYDSARGDDALGPNAGYHISYRGNLVMTKVWQRYKTAKLLWSLGSGNTPERWKEKTFSGTWPISFRVDPTVVDYNPDLMNCSTLQQSIIEQNPDTTFGEIMRCDPNDPNAVSYDPTTGQYSAKFTLVKEDGSKVYSTDLDDEANQPDSLHFTTPTGALYVKQSSFEAGKTFEMTEPRVTGDFAMDAFFIGMPVTFDATGSSLPLTMVTTYDATYEFASTTAGQALPPAVLDLRPERTTMLRTDATVTPPGFSPTTVRDGQGEWAFTGWAPESHTVGTEDVAFTGNWAYAVDPDAVFEVTYRYVTDSAVPFPAAVTDTLPASSTEVQGTVVTPPTPTRSPIAVEGGTWRFDGWAPSTATVDGADLEFAGTWTFEKASAPTPKPGTEPPAKKPTPIATTGAGSLGGPAAGAGVLITLGLVTVAIAWARRFARR